MKSIDNHLSTWIPTNAAWNQPFIRSINC